MKDIGEKKTNLTLKGQLERRFKYLKKNHQKKEDSDDTSGPSDAGVQDMEQFDVGESDNTMDGINEGKFVV